MKFLFYGVFLGSAYDAIFAPDFSAIVKSSLLLALTLCLYPVFRRQTESQQQ